MFVEAITGAERDVDFAVAGDAGGAEVEKIAAFETDVAGGAVERVIRRVDFDEWVELVDAAPVVVEMEAGIDEIGAQTIDAKRIARGVYEGEAAVVEVAEVLRDAEI